MNSPAACLKYANERELFFTAAPRSEQNIGPKSIGYSRAAHFLLGTADKTIPLPSRIVKI